MVAGAGAGAGHIEQMPLGLVDFFEVGIIRDFLDPLDAARGLDRIGDDPEFGDLVAEHPILWGEDTQPNRRERAKLIYYLAE
jgi:hypothetical protein